MPDFALDWQLPPEPINQILNAPPNPSTYLSPTRRWLLQLDRPNLCDISVLTEPEIGIAGFRIHPRTNTPAPVSGFRRMWIQEIETKQRKQVDFPEDVQIKFISWSPDGEKIAFTLTQANGLELWTLEMAEGKPWRVTEPILNGTYGKPYQWLSATEFLCKVVPERGYPPIEPNIPRPSIQENLGAKTPNRTYTDLLSNAHDEALFEYYITSTLEKITLRGERSPLLAPCLLSESIPSPDGKFILLETKHRPFSFQVTSARFPTKLEIIDLTGKVIYQLADLPLNEQRSMKFDAVRLGPRQAGWRQDRPSTLVWIEALDDGDPSRAVSHRDRMLELNAPFTTEPREVWRSADRFAGVLWGCENVALAWERDYDSRRLRMWRIDPSQFGVANLLCDRSFEDLYRSPGQPMTMMGQYQQEVLRFTPDGRCIYLKGRGASPEGVYPFLDLMNLTTGKTERIWQCEDPYFETVVEILADGVLLTRRQSQTEPPNYYLRGSGLPILLTDNVDPAPELVGLQKELLAYERADGVSLSATLYLPAGYDPQRDGTLPTIFWVYPAEFKDAELAGQKTTAENTFSRPSGTSVVFLVTQGYAVVSDPTLPIIGAGEQEPNDTYIEQLILGATAAVDYLVDRGIAALGKLGIGGHSYGAFTVANLLAHTDLFKVGIARSGAYNRTLTPFGFQGEQRNFWEATETYHQMSPFTHAEKITAPLLLIHGASDRNVGTYPIQTQRFYEALKGLGATVRWVELPFEDHSYRSKEAVGHVLWEMVRWCDRYLK